MAKKEVILDFKPTFKEDLDNLKEKDQRIIQEKIQFLKNDPRRGDRILNLVPDEFREIHAGRHRLFHLIEETEALIKISFLIIDLRRDNDKTYGKKILNQARTIART